MNKLSLVAGPWIELNIIHVQERTDKEIDELKQKINTQSNELNQVYEQRNELKSDISGIQNNIRRERIGLIVFMLLFFLFFDIYYSMFWEFLIEIELTLILGVPTIWYIIKWVKGKLSPSEET